MTGVIFFFESTDKDVWSGRPMDMDVWNYACKVAGDIDKAYIVNTSGVVFTPFDVTMDIKYFNTLDEALAQTSGTKAYLTCPWNAGNQQPITSLDHSTVDWYVVGGGDGWQTPVDGYYLPQAGLGAVHSVHAFTATMFHRYWSLNSGS